MFDEEFDDSEEEEDESWEDDDYEEDEEYEDDEDFDDWEPSREVVVGRASSERLEAFIDDPWPSLAFVMILVGFAVVLPWPPSIWFAWSYFILGFYFILIVSGAAVVLSLETWIRSPTRSRYLGPVFLIALVAVVLMATVDTISWLQTGASILPELTGPYLLQLALLIDIFAVYTMWIVRRSFTEETVDDE
ncbi:MAG: hypothetical protein ACFFH0_07145 [Promethearchaeota archaeon]